MHIFDVFSISSYCSNVNIIPERYVEVCVSFLLLYYNYQEDGGKRVERLWKPIT
ncbi:hypothetical protein ANBU17_20620 [Anaerostipes butyraticus]|uniref:Uncharacterized protein n=1 Tax=Anaerostipes butyraticus TaxID=645466 RepID=A0A916QAK4_9FIRM|nr:hypothetical protein ANBU17_20620 [Anaerostipes butyraticus]